MIPGWLCLRMAGSLSLIVVIGLSATIYSSPAQPGTCPLPSHHAGVTFPVEQIEAHWACRLEPIISRHTTANKLGPLRTPLPQVAYLYLLDHPPMAASLVNRLGIAPYQSEIRGPGRYWGNDGEGTAGTVELVYQDRTSRVYYLEGSHDSRFLHHITGKAVVLLRMNQVTDVNGVEAMDSTLISYTRLDNRLLSGIVSLLRPLTGSAVTRKLAKGVDSVNRLSQVMRQQPDRVLSEATKPSALSSDEMAFLKHTLEDLSHSSSATQSRTSSP
ncbi:MAG: hypothetical protein KJS98_01100 [Nitrospirae bacterium]|nr:hypothetical protein [Nitrospirota bacterium]